MAKKDKNDEIEDNDNNDNKRDNRDDFNEADDSFGLPHVDYEPLDSDEERTEEPDEMEEVNAPVGDNADYSSDRDETIVEEETTYIPGSYVPPKDNSAAPKLIILALIIIIAGLGVWYFGYYKPEQKAIERARVEEQKKADLQEQREAQVRAERERAALEQAQLEEEARLAAEAKPKIGTIETISSRTGRYYVVIASSIDEDLAMDHAKKLSKSGISTSIIEPFGSSKFHRIVVAKRDSWAAAQNEANALKEVYGDGVWVIKY